MFSYLRSQETYHKRDTTATTVVSYGVSSGIFFSRKARMSRVIATLQSPHEGKAEEPHYICEASFPNHPKPLAALALLVCQLSGIILLSLPHGYRTEPRSLLTVARRTRQGPARSGYPRYLWRRRSHDRGIRFPSHRTRASSIS